MDETFKHIPTNLPTLPLYHVDDGGRWPAYSDDKGHAIRVFEAMPDWYALVPNGEVMRKKEEFWKEGYTFTTVPRRNNIAKSILVAAFISITEYDEPLNPTT
jgi:hypothetical protein